MRTEDFRDHHYEVPLLDLLASCSYRTETSIALGLYRFESANARSQRGTLDVHHPCDGHVKTLIRCQLPKSYLKRKQIAIIIKEVFVALHIPADETFDAYFYSERPQQGLSQNIDRNGKGSRI